MGAVWQEARAGRSLLDLDSPARDNDLDGCGSLTAERGGEITVEVEVFASPWLNLMVSLAILAVLVAVAWYVIPKIRSDPSQKEPGADELMANFRKMHERGELSEAEFRTIRTTLAGQYREKLNDTDEKG